MADQDTILVQLGPETHRILVEGSLSKDAAGASAFAGAILEQWAADTKAAQIRAGVDRAAAYLKAHPDGWDDDPNDFFGGTPT